MAWTISNTSDRAEWRGVHDDDTTEDLDELSALITPCSAASPYQALPAPSSLNSKRTANSAAQELVARIDKLRLEAEELARAALDDHHVSEELRRQIRQGTDRREAMLKQKAEEVEAKLTRTRQAIEAAKASVRQSESTLATARHERDQAFKAMCAYGGKLVASHLERDWLSRIVQSFDEKMLTGFRQGDNVVILKKGRFLNCTAAVIGLWNGRIKVRMNQDDSVKSYMPYDLRSLVFSEGEHVRIAKPGTYKGQTCTIVDPAWGERIKVRMADGSTKSYLPTEMEELIPQKAIAVPET